MKSLFDWDTVPCFRVHMVHASIFNLALEVDNASVVSDYAKEKYTSWHRAVPMQYVYGCAVHFLFTFVPVFDGLLGNVALAVSHGSVVPDSFVAVHLRFGDDALSGSRANENLSVVTASLACASALAQEVMSSEAKWGIFFSSDSDSARKFAMGWSAEYPVFMTGDAPLHISKSETGSIWRVLGDFFMLASAQGLVQWSDPAHFPLTLSSFSSIPAQMSFLPTDHRRIADTRELDMDMPVCRPTSR